LGNKGEKNMTARFKER